MLKREYITTTIKLTPIYYKYYIYIYYIYNKYYFKHLHIKILVLVGLLLNFINI